jgi:two-component system phosphate regulon response regulator PhoB
VSEGRVFVLEDDPDIVEYLSSFLEDEGFDVASANRCSAALEALDIFRPEVVLIDALLPGKSGLDFLVTVRRHERWSELPLVVVTGNDQLLQDDCQSYLGAHEGVRGPDGVLGKPVDLDTLLKVIRRLINSVPA